MGVLISVGVILLLAWALCHAPSPSRDDAEQMRYLQEWRERHDRYG